MGIQMEGWLTRYAANFNQLNYNEMTGPRRVPTHRNTSAAFPAPPSTIRPPLAFSHNLQAEHQECVHMDTHVSLPADALRRLSLSPSTIPSVWHPPPHQPNTKNLVLHVSQPAGASYRVGKEVSWRCDFKLLIAGREEDLRLKVG